MERVARSVEPIPGCPMKPVSIMWSQGVDTSEADRDKHLRSADFFDVDNHPQVRFASDGATLDGERLTVSGRLYAAGTSTPLNLDARLRRAGESRGCRPDRRKNAR